MTTQDASRLAFFLGGHDLEMLTIARVLGEQLPSSTPIHDAGLSWGAKASDYANEIRTAIHDGLRPVLIELEDDLGLGSAAIHIDHHGSSAATGAKTSLQQVFELLALPQSKWSRWLDLVAANDRGWIPELRRIGASDAEIERVRAADRTAQGITAEEDASAADALNRTETLAGGRLLVVRLLSAISLKSPHPIT